MRIKKFQSLRFKLSLIMVLFALVPATIVGVVTVTRMQDSILLEQKRSVENQLSLVSDNIDTIFNTMEGDVGYFANSNTVKLADDTITSYVDVEGSVLMTPGSNGGIEQQIYEDFYNFGLTHPNYRYLYIGTEDGGCVQYPEGNIGTYDPRILD